MWEGAWCSAVEGRRAHITANASKAGRHGKWPASGRGSGEASAYLAHPAGATRLRRGCEQWSLHQTPGAAPPAAHAPLRGRSAARRSAAPRAQSASAAAGCRRRLHTASAWRWCICTVTTSRQAVVPVRTGPGHVAKRTLQRMPVECQPLLDPTPRSLDCLVCICPGALCQGMAAIISWEKKEACAAPAPTQASGSGGGWRLPGGGCGCGCGGGRVAAGEAGVARAAAAFIDAVACQSCCAPGDGWLD
jgi:hypothetical protein